MSYVNDFYAYFDQNCEEYKKIMNYFIFEDYLKKLDEAI